MKVFEFKQIESGSNFRIEIDYHHYMQKQTAWLDGDILEMGEKPLELVNARLYVDDELKYSSNVVSGYDLKLSEDIRTIKGYKVRTVHALKLAIINTEVWEKYEEWLEEVIKDGTEPEVKEFQKREKEKAAAEAEYQEKRTAAKEEYRRLVEAGELRDKTIIEKTLTRAQGHPDNESVQAARRICEKRGYDWRTGEKIPAFKTEGLKTDELKTVTVTSKDLDL